jgi:hypothetical protein
MSAPRERPDTQASVGRWGVVRLTNKGLYVSCAPTEMVGEP